jgi:hypothetical protein
VDHAWHRRRASGSDQATANVECARAGKDVILIDASEGVVHALAASKLRLAQVPPAIPTRAPAAKKAWLIV